MGLEQLLPDYVGDVNRAYDQGRQRAAQKGLAGLASNYYAQQGNDTLAQMAAFDPGAAMQFQKVQDGDLDRKKARLGELAGYLLAAPEEQRPQVWAQMQPEVDQLVPGAGQTPYGQEVIGIAQWAVDQYGPQGQGIPAGVQEFNAYTTGMSPEDKAKAARIHLGLDPRASSGLPYGFMEVVGADGVTRVIQTNKREGGAAEIGPGGVPSGAGAGTGGMPASAPPVGAPGGLSAAVNLSARHRFQPTSFGRTPEENAKLPGSAKNSNHLTEDALDFSIQGKSPQQIQAFVAEMAPNGWIGKIHMKGTAPHLHFDYVGAQGPNPYASRPAEQQAGMNAAATEQAKVDVQVQNAPTVSRVQADAEAEKARAKALAESQAAGEVDLPRQIDNANAALKVINELLMHPGRKAATGLSSKTDPRNKLPGSPAYDFNVKVAQLKGKAFLEAFNSLKGGGAITEIEGQKATDAIAALDTAQSEEQYAAALRDLGDVIRAGANRARIKAGRAPIPIAPRGAAPAKFAGFKVLD